MSNPKTITAFLQGLPIPWLAGGPEGQANWGALGQVLDAEIDQLRQSVKAHMPTLAPADALPYIGGDRKLAQGPTESAANFRTRCLTAWGNSPITVAAPGLPPAQSGGPSSGWALAGTWLQLLEELYWGGFGGGVLVQQNGLACSLTGTPVAGTDNSGLLSRVSCSALAVTLTSSVTQTRSIPMNTPWWFFAESRSVNANVVDTDYCNRFALLYPGVLPSAFFTWARATFTASDTAAITWNNAFPTSMYVIMPGTPTITSGGPVLIGADGTTQTQTGVTIRASGAFTGTVDVIAAQVGANPFADLHPADLARLQSLIATWRPNSMCVGVYAIVQGKFMGWPVQAQSANTMGPFSIVRFEGA